jgi:zinc transporter 9
LRESSSLIPCSPVSIANVGSSFIAGILPLSLSLSSRQLRSITLLGTGVLVGTSLIVIIPEGIETMYSVGKNAHSHAREGPAKAPSTSGQQKGVKYPLEAPPLGRAEVVDTEFLRAGAIKAPLLDVIVRRTPDAPLAKADRASDDKQKEQQKVKDTHDDKNPQPQKGGDDDSTEGHREGHTRIHPPEEGEKKKVEEVKVEEEGLDPHAYIGVSLILGFILMFVVDHLPQALAPSRPKYQPLHISLSDLSRGPHNSSSLSLNTLNVPASPMPERYREPQPKSSATTVGLIIHAFADGIALGASSTAPSTSLSLIIFLAIMLHKAPAAFGMTAVLLKQGISKRTARTHLVFFSLAAPAGAMFTWAVVHTLGRARLGGDMGLTWITGWILIFSGGTFLYVYLVLRSRSTHADYNRYVAMHSMNDATSSHAHDPEPTANGYMEAHGHDTGLSKSDICTTMVGMLLPLLTQVGHVH